MISIPETRRFNPRILAVDSLILVETIGSFFYITRGVLIVQTESALFRLGLATPRHLKTLEEPVS